MFARENKADEHNPWAIIIRILPIIPHIEFLNRPVRRSPIWPTDE